MTKRPMRNASCISTTVIEPSCQYMLDWNYDEDRCRIRTGPGNAPFMGIR